MDIARAVGEGVMRQRQATHRDMQREMGATDDKLPQLYIKQPMTSGLTERRFTLKKVREGVISPLVKYSEPRA